MKILSHSSANSSFWGEAGPPTSKKKPAMKKVVKAMTLAILRLRYCQRTKAASSAHMMPEVRSPMALSVNCIAVLQRFWFPGPDMPGRHLGLDIVSLKKKPESTASLLNGVGIPLSRALHQLQAA